MIEFFSSSLGIAALVIVALVVIYFTRPKTKELDNNHESSHVEQIAVSKVDSPSDKKNRKDDLEIVASIMAALSAYLDVPASKLRINSIKHVDGNASAWRRESFENR
jgi:hypothetical protein